MNDPTMVTTDQTTKVWDPLVRLFHWSLVVSFAVAWLTAEDWADLHQWAGYTAAALIVFRLVWGIFGSNYSQFRQFVPSPGTVISFTRAMWRREEPRYIGHNPLGSLMILGLLAAMSVTALTGWMYTLDAFWGVDWVEETHEAMATLMLAMVAVHIAGVLYASYTHKENLVRAMFTGKKRAAGAGDQA
jgi:cytochrome b